MFAPLGAWPTGAIGFEAVGEVEVTNPTGLVVPATLAARTAEAAAW